MRLLGVELTRLSHRRAVIVLVILGALAIGGIAVGVLYNERPVSGAELADAQRYADQQNEAPYTQRHYTRCLETRDATDAVDAQFCEDRWLSTPDQMLYRPQLDLTEYKGWVLSMGGLAAAIALLVGATFVGGDIASGSVGTQLLFQPSRWKVWAAKTGAVAAGMAVFGSIVLGGANGVIWLFAKLWDRPIPPGTIADFSGSVGRAIVFTAASGVVGFALALIARHTAAALGVLAVYGIAAETVLRLVWQGSERWLLSNHVGAFIAGPFRRTIFRDCDGFGRCEPDVYKFTLGFSSAYLGLGLLAVSAIALLLFQRRDVP